MRVLLALVGLGLLGLNHAVVAKTEADEIIRLTGFLDTSEADEETRNSFEVLATSTEMSVKLQRRVRGTRKPEAREIEAQFKINESAFIRSWRSLALAAHAQSPVRQGRTVETRRPNGYWVIFPEGSSETTSAEAHDRPAGRDDSLQLVTTTLARLDAMLSRKEYEDMKVFRSEGDIIPATIVGVKELLATPKKWDGKRVRIFGWTSVGEEERQLQPSRLSAWLSKLGIPGLGTLGIWIGEESTIARGWDTVQPLQTGPRELEGIVRAADHGHLGAFVCTIDRLTINRAN